MVVAADGTTRTWRYWDFDFREPEHALKEADYLDELDHLFRQAVTRQLVADVPVQSYLSGGIDFGSITAVRRARSGTCAPSPSGST